MVVVISIKGLHETRRYFDRVKYKIPPMCESLANEVARFMQKSAKLRAPRDTGNLANSITVNSIASGMFGSYGVEVAVQAHYGRFQEEGFTPHVIPFQFMELHKSNPGVRGMWVPPGEITGWAMVRRNKPFIMPAFWKTVEELPRFCERYGRKITGEGLASPREGPSGMGALGWIKYPANGGR